MPVLSWDAIDRGVVNILALLEYTLAVDALIIAYGLADVLQCAMVQFLREPRCVMSLHEEVIRVPSKTRHVFLVDVAYDRGLLRLDLDIVEYGCCRLYKLVEELGVLILDDLPQFDVFLDEAFDQDID